MIHKLLTYLLLFTTYTVVFSQNKTVIDSLKNAKISASKIDKANILNRLGWEYRLHNPDSALYYSDQALSIAKSLDNHRVIGTALNYIGLAHGYKGEYSAAFKIFHKSMDYATEHGDPINLAHAQNGLGRLLFSQGDLINSYEYFFSALAIFDSIDNKAGMGYCYKSLSELYLAQNNFKKALSMSLKALEIRKKLGNKRGQISSYHEIAEIHLQLEQYEKALEYLNIALDISTSSKDDISLVETYLGISNILYHQNLYDKSLEYALTSLAPYFKVKNQAVLNTVHLQLGKTYFSLGDLAKSKEYLLKLTNLQAQSSALVLIRDANYYLSKIHEQANENSLALQYLQAYNIVNDSINNNDIARTIERMEIRLELQNIGEENKLLKAQKIIDKAEIEEQKNKNLALSFATVLFILIAFFVIRHSRQKVRHNHKLSTKNTLIEEQNRKIQNQNAKLEKRNDELAELNREKDNLMNIVSHDLRSPFNNLKGIAELIRISGDLNKEQIEYVDLLKGVATRGSDLIRDILDVNAFDITDKTNTISKINVSKFIYQVVSEFSESAIQKNIEIKINPTDPQINLLSEESHLSRIIDNLMSNAIKYAPKNTRIEITGFRKGNLTHIIVKDQGPGFSEEDQKNLYKKFKKLSARPTGGEHSNGLGLAIVKMLTERLKATITLNTSDTGSEFIISLPDID